MVTYKLKTFTKSELVSRKSYTTGSVRINNCACLREMTDIPLWRSDEVLSLDLLLASKAVKTKEIGLPVAIETISVSLRENGSASTLF